MHTSNPAALSPSSTTSHGGDLLQSIATAWRDLRTAAADHAQARRDLETLAHLDDRTLADMGLTRHDIPVLVRGGLLHR